MEKIKVLQLLGGGNSIGGVEQMLLNYYSFINRDIVNFDFCFYRKSTYDTVISLYGDVLENSQIINLNAFPGRSSFLGYLKTINKVRKLIKNNKYDIVHINAGRPPLLVCGLLSSWLAGTKVRITHSHSTRGKDDRNPLKCVIYNVASICMRPLFCLLSTQLFACSTAAGKYMFGKNAVYKHNYKLVHNAVNINLYKYNSAKRSIVRNAMDIPSYVTLYGHVGRFSMEKNQLFLIDVFSEIHKRDSKTMLWLIGDGDENLKEQIKQRIEYYGLNESVILLGSRNDVRDLDQALDALIFPSTYEGLSVVLIEAQCSSLPIFASDSISPEHKVSDLVHFLPLEKGKKYWADIIIEEAKHFPMRKDITDVITANGYNIAVEAEALQKFYIKEVQK